MAEDYRNIHLRGGPFDGTRMTWRGGDILERVQQVGPPLSVKTPPEPTQKDVRITVRKIYYRKSICADHIFVYQPYE